MNCCLKKLFLIILAGVCALGTNSVFSSTNNNARSAAVGFASVGASLGTSVADLNTAQPASPSWGQRLLAGVGAVGATGGSLYGIYRGLNWLMPAALDQARPWAALGLTAVLGYQIASPMFYTLYTSFAGNRHEWRDQIAILEANEESIKDILREINYVRNKMIEDVVARKEQERTLAGNRQDVANALQSDVFTKKLMSISNMEWHKLPASLLDEHGQQKNIPIREVLKATQALKAPRDTTNLEWWAVVERMRSTINSFKRMYAVTQQSIYAALHRFDADAALLKTWGGPDVESAAKELLNAVDYLYNQNGMLVLDTAEENFKKFTRSAEVIINYAEFTLKTLRDYRYAAMRIEKMSDWLSGIGSGAYNVLPTSETIDRCSATLAGLWLKA